jgi:hypothetical protein
MAYQARLPNDRRAAIKDDEMRNAADVESVGDLRIAFGVHLYYDRPSGHVCSRAGNLRGRDTARPTPPCPEIGKYRDTRILNDLVEQVRVDFQWLARWTQRSFASPTAASIDQSDGRNTILAPTRHAVPKKGHPYLQYNSSNLEDFNLRPSDPIN